MRTLILVFVLLTSVASAQPQTQPIYGGYPLTYLGSFTAPGNDGSGLAGTDDDLTYGGFGLGLGPDGVSLYFGCSDPGDRIARISIATIGGVASIVEPCTEIPNRHQVDPGGTSNGVQVGGTLAYHGTFVATVFSYYDNTPTAIASHFYGPNLGTLSGPVALTVNPRITAGYMGLIPPEWRPLFGGPAFTGLSNINVIDSSSYGPSISVFNPDDLGVTTPAPATLLLRYTLAQPFIHEWRTLGVGGVAFPSGTRSVLFFVRMGTGTPCYGTGGATGGTCVDPVSSSNGYHAYPYTHRVYQYDANHLIEVKNGTRTPGSVQPVSWWDVPNFSAVEGAAELRSAAYDDATRRWYAVEKMSGGVTPRVHVFSLPPLVPPPPPPLTLDLDTTATKTTCKITVTALPPDATGGWGVQFTLNGANLSTRDTSSPYTRTKSGVAMGSVIGGTWTKAGQPSQSIAEQIVECS